MATTTVRTKDLGDRELLELERRLEEDLALEERRNEGAEEELRAFHAPAECMGLVYARANALSEQLDEVWLAVRRRGLKPWPRGW